MGPENTSMQTHSTGGYSADVGREYGVRKWGKWLTLLLRPAGHLPNLTLYKETRLPLPSRCDPMGLDRSESQDQITWASWCHWGGGWVVPGDRQPFPQVVQDLVCRILLCKHYYQFLFTWIVKPNNYAYCTHSFQFYYLMIFEEILLPFLYMKDFYSGKIRNEVLTHATIWKNL